MADNFKRSIYMNDAILQKVTSLGVAPDAQVANLARSGQLGTGIRTAKLDGATPAIFNPVVGVVLTVPSMWDRWPKLQEMLKAVMETHAKSISGIDFNYSLETADTQVGHDGQTLKVPTRTTRSGVDPSATFIEYPGLPIYNLFRTWMFNIQHPDTNASMLPAIADSTDIPAWQVSAYSMSMLFIQYDPTGLPDRIYDASVITNMFPTSIGDIGFERSIGSTKTIERTIQFTGLVQHNENTRELGYRVAEMLALHKINYQFSLPGLAGSTDPDVAIQKELRSYGGYDYEAGTSSASVQGAIDQFSFQSTEGNNAYSDMIDSGSSVIPASGAATSDVGSTS
jgi:hypothetical protein